MTQLEIKDDNIIFPVINLKIETKSNKSKKDKPETEISFRAGVNIMMKEKGDQSSNSCLRMRTCARTFTFIKSNSHNFPR